MWFCMIDILRLRIRHEIGIDRSWECDYPHRSVWPNTQASVEELFGLIPDDEAEMILFRTAEQLFSWTCAEPVAAGVQAGA
jgi:predicted TIM-barrel fold metal-dependent hydrolase